MRRIICILCLAALCLSLSACSKHTHKIDDNDVEKVTIYSQTYMLEFLDLHTDGVELNAEDQAKLLQLYNDANYGGTKRSDNPSDTYVCIIHLRDGSIITLNTRHNDDVLLRYSADGYKVSEIYFLQSRQLHEFMDTLYEKYL